MKIEVSDFYKEKYRCAYLLINKEHRRVVCLITHSGKRTSMSYAKYLFTSYYKCIIPEGYEVDHINNDKLDDRIENFQILSKKDNIIKSHSMKEFIIRECPICHKNFIYEKCNLSTHPNPCCSRRCGGKQSYLTAKKNGTAQIKKLHYCKQCGNPIENYHSGKVFCSEKCKFEYKGYPSYQEIIDKYNDLKSWEKVASYFNITRKIIRGIRRNHELLTNN